jgi:AcrR family transcriptional regulator
MAVVKKTRDAARTRTALLDAAERLFAERGYDATSLQAVGQAAGVSRGTAGYFFGSKDGLYRAVFDRAFARLQERLETTYAQALECGSPNEAIDEVVAAYLDFPHDFVRLVEREALQGAKALEALEPRLTQIHTTLERLTAIIEAHFRPVPPAFLLLSIVALTWFPVAHADSTLRALGLDPRDEAFLGDYRRFLTELLVAGLERNGHS